MRFEKNCSFAYRVCAILICATTAKAKHTCMCNNLISVQKSARGKQRTQLALLKYSLFFSSIRPSFVDTLSPVNRLHPCKPATWNVIIGDYYYEYH